MKEYVNKTSLCHENIIYIYLSAQFPFIDYQYNTFSDAASDFGCIIMFAI